MYFILFEKSMTEISEKYNLNQFKFDWDLYVQSTRGQILDKIEKSWWKLYLEICWDPVKDQFAFDLMQWYSSDITKKIFLPLKDQTDILFCVNSDDILDSEKTINGVPYADFLETKLMVIERTYWVKPIIVINNIDISAMFDLILNFERRFQKKQYRVFERYKISWYPYNLKNMLSENWFWEDDHIPVTKKLVLVMWWNENCGKFSTCLGQIYLDSTIEIVSWYAKLFILPLCDLPLDHAINSAYSEMSWSELCLDKNWGTVNKWDIEKIDILMSMANRIFEWDSYIMSYKNVWDMIINVNFLI